MPTPDMDALIVRKPRSMVEPNLRNWDAERRFFTWDAARSLLCGLPDGAGLNIAHECVDRHAHREDTALRWRGAHGESIDISWSSLAKQSSRAANAFHEAGVRPGERVFLLLPRIPELYVVAMGALKGRHVVCALFSAFGPDPIRERMSLGDARVLVTTSGLYARKVAPIRDQLPGLRHVFITGIGEPPPGTVSLDAAMAAARQTWAIPPTSLDDPALLHFTSGTTGRPKGALHVHGAVLHHVVSAMYALDLRQGDLFWCTADPGWVTGTSYGIVAPLALGVESVVYEGEFDAAAWYSVLSREGVSVWYTAPTAVRMMMKAGTGLAKQRPLPRLRFIASVGEPLNAEAVRWGNDAFGLPIHDNWWQTETGGILIANFAGMDIKPGSMGKPLPGVTAALMRRRDDGTLEPVGPGIEGEIAIRRGWPSLFREYLDNPERTSRCFVGDWYLSGDLARVDPDGYFWFVGRADDVIKTAGHLVGPTEVERVLTAHAAVVEAAVIGKPDPMAFETIKAFVVLRPGFEASEELRLGILGHARRHLGAAIAPKEVEIVATLPRTRSGKILRRLLRARELGLPEGDTSSLEDGAP